MPTPTENKEFWEQHLEQLNASGLSRSQYCRDHSINYDRFGYWLKRLSTISPSFVPVKIKMPEVTTSQVTLCAIELRGHHLKIYDLSALSLLLERLAS